MKVLKKISITTLIILLISFGLVKWKGDTRVQTYYCEEVKGKIGNMLTEDPEGKFKIYRYEDAEKGICVAWEDKLYLLSEPVVPEDVELLAITSDFDRDGEKEYGLILHCYDDECSTYQNRLYIFEEKKGELYWNIYDPASDTEDNFSAQITADIVEETKKVTLIWRETGEELLEVSYEGWVEDGVCPESVLYSSNVQLEAERGKFYLTVPIMLKSEDSEVQLPRKLKLEIIYQDSIPNFSARPAKQLERIAISKDELVAAYGASPGTTYQSIVLRIGDDFYDTELEWHTDYGEAAMEQADYDGDGLTETAFFYPYGVASFAGRGLLVIDQSENGKPVWTELFPSEAWVQGMVEEQCQKLLDWKIDKETGKVYVTDAFSGKEVFSGSYDIEEMGADIEKLKGILFTSVYSYVLEEGKLYMDISPVIVFEQRVVPYYLEGSIRMEVVYKEKKMGGLKLPE